MKSFLATFLACMVLVYGFLLFGGAMIFQNFWALLVFVSLVIAVLARLFDSQNERVKQLEERIRALESEKVSGEKAEDGGTV